MQADLLGQGDSIRVAYTNTDGSNEVNVAYALPVNAHNGTFRVRYDRTWSQVIEPPFAELDIRGNLQELDLSFRQPVILTPEREVALGVGVSHQASETFILGIPFPLSPGADEQGHTRLLVVNCFQEWTQRGQDSVFAARSELSVGLGVLDATLQETPPDGQFIVWRGQSQWVLQIRPDTLVLLRSDLQLANRPLVPLEQYGLGGLESVRGYRQDALLTDNGAFASAELRVPIYRTTHGRGLLQWTPFLEVGRAWNSGGRANPNPNFLAAVGMGVRWQWSDRVLVRLESGDSLGGARHPVDPNPPG